MKKRSILTVLIALFLVSLISCADSNSGGGSGNGNGGGGGSGTGGLNYTPELEEDDESTFNLGYYIRGDGTQERLFNKCEEGSGYKLENFGPSCNNINKYLPYSSPAKLDILPHATETVKHTLTSTNENMLICFNITGNACVTELDKLPAHKNPHSSDILVQINPAKLEELKANKTPEITGSFNVLNNYTNVTNTYHYKVKFIDAVTPSCINDLTCDTPKEINGKLILTNATPLAGLNIWDWFTKGHEVGFLKNLEIKFEDGFSDIFTIDTRTTCSIKNSVVSIDKNCELFISKKQEVTGKSTLNIDAIMVFSDGIQADVELVLDATYTFIAE